MGEKSSFLAAGYTEGLPDSGKLVFTTLNHACSYICLSKKLIKGLSHGGLPWSSPTFCLGNVDSGFHYEKRKCGRKLYPAGENIFFFLHNLSKTSSVCLGALHKVNT